MTTLSMDGTDPATWDPALDGVLAAPENHTVLYEDEAIRVISVSIAPGAIEKPHHHCLPAVFVVDRLVSVRDFNGATGEEIPLPIPKDREISASAAPLCREPRHEAVSRDPDRVQTWVPNGILGAPRRGGPRRWRRAIASNRSGRPRLCRARVDRIRVDLARFAKPSWNGRHLHSCRRLTADRGGG
jgi:hypothetical protein